MELTTQHEATIELEHESAEETFPFALSSHNVTMPFESSKGLLPFSDGGVASVAYTSCSESIGTSSFLHDRPSLSSSTQHFGGAPYTTTPTTTDSSTTKTPSSRSITLERQKQQHQAKSNNNDITTSSPIHTTVSQLASTTIMHSHASLDESEIRKESFHVDRDQSINRSGVRRSLNYSQLMERADDATLSTIPLTQSYYMPPLVEEHEDGQQLGPSSSLENHDDGWLDAMNAWVTGNGSQARLSNPSSSLTASSPKKMSQPLPANALADTFGAKITLPDGIEACQMSHTQMEVRLVLNDQSMQESRMNNHLVPTVQEIMDVISNPELLGLWCEPVSAVIVTNTSDGARGVSSHCPEQDRGRMYDGEWIEGTTNMLVTPSSHLHYFYMLGNIFWSSLGFPSYGKVTMFVERQRGQVGMTLGPFPDGLVASHTFVIQSEENGSVSVVNKLEMRYESEDGDSSCHCNLLQPLEQMFSSQNKGYLEQAVSSMRHLRHLLQEGGEVGAFIMDSGSMEGDLTDDFAVVKKDPGGLTDTTAQTPLLG